MHEHERPIHIYTAPNIPINFWRPRYLFGAVLTVADVYGLFADQTVCTSEISALGCVCEKPNYYPSKYLPFEQEMAKVGNDVRYVHAQVRLHQPKI